MSPIAGFGLSFAVTLVLLGGVVVTGKLRRVRVHVACVVATVVSLAWTVHEAYRVGEVYDLASAGWITPVHLGLAKVATGALVLPVVTGLRVVLGGKGARLHARVAWAVVGLVVVTAVTGVVMIGMAEER